MPSPTAGTCGSGSVCRKRVSQGLQREKSNEVLPAMDAGESALWEWEDHFKTGLLQWFSGSFEP